jgi:hypothetical protein
MDLVTTFAYHTANSYGTLAEADAYFTSYDRLGSSATWDDLTDDQKKYALMLAAQVLNTFSFRGLKCTKAQKLAFPRYTRDQLNGDYAQLDSFYDITYTKVIDEEELNVANNRFVATNSSADEFEDYVNDGLYINQMIKVVRGSTEYLTIKDMDIDGEWVEVNEDIEEETDLTTIIYGSDIFGYPQEVKYAQFELAYQVVDTKLFQGTVGDETEYPVWSFNISGAMTVRYKMSLSNANKFEHSAPLDIVYYLLGPWIAGTKGGLV